MKQVASQKRVHVAGDNKCKTECGLVLEFGLYAICLPVIARCRTQCHSCGLEILPLGDMASRTCGLSRWHVAPTRPFASEHPACCRIGALIRTHAMPRFMGVCLGELLGIPEARFSRGRLLHTHRCEIRTILYLWKCHYMHN